MGATNSISQEEQHRVNLTSTYSLRVCKKTTADKSSKEYLNYIGPDAVPVWANSKTMFITKIMDMESVQRLFRQICTSNHFPVGTKMVVYRVMYTPEYKEDKVYYTKVCDEKLKRCTMIKPLMDTVSDGQ